MNLYNHTRNLIQSGAVDLDALRVMLVSTQYSFSASATNMAGITAEEISGNGWPAGGPLIANVTSTVTDTNASALDGDNISVTATGGDIGPAAGLVVWDATNDRPLFYYEFPEPQTAGAGTDFNVTWHADGIHVIQAV